MTNPAKGWSGIARRIRVPLGFGFALVYVWLAKPNISYMTIGVIIVATGLLLRASASGHVRKNEQLAITGPYAYTRNPLYLGSLIMAVGFGIAGRNLWIGAIIVAFFLAIYLPVIRSEEAFLRGKFPEFDAYSSSVPRLWVRLTPFERGGRFSWQLYRQHREYNALIGSLILFVILIAKWLWRTKSGMQ